MRAPPPPKAVALAVVPSKALVLLLLIHCLFLHLLFVGFYFWSLFCYAVLNVLSSCAIISIRKRELVALL